MNMNNRRFYITPGTEALRQAGKFLAARGCAVTEEPGLTVTHLLLPVPSLENENRMRGGEELEAVLHRLPENITVLGGNLDVPQLEHYQKKDFLQDPRYLAKNAAITAECALRIAFEKLPTTLSGLPVLVLGWGRIGQCLAKLLQAMGAEVTIAARNPSAQAIACALGYTAVPLSGLEAHLVRYRILFNTIPAPVLTEKQVIYCRPDCIKIDLASSPGIGGSGVICAKGLPGKMAPEASGQLIARTAIRLCLE